MPIVAGISAFSRDKHLEIQSNGQESEWTALKPSVTSPRGGELAFRPARDNDR